MPRVTVVNDNPEFLELVGEILSHDRYTTTLVDGDRPDAVERVRESRPDVLMIDLRMGREELHGWKVAQEVRRQPDLDELPILVCSADTRALETVAHQLNNTRCVATLPKPFGIDELCVAIDRLIDEATSSFQPA